MINKKKTFLSFLREIKKDIYFYTNKSRFNLYLCITNLLLNTSLQLVLLYRLCHFCYVRRWYKLSSIFEWLQIVIFHSRIDKKAHIGENFKIAHSTGIVIGLAKIGDNVSIWQNVTIGASGRKNEKGIYPTIEDNVKIFASAVVVGNIRIGRGAKIGALSFVNIDIPAGSTAVGIPVRIIQQNKTENHIFNSVNGKKRY